MESLEIFFLGLQTNQVFNIHLMDVFYLKRPSQFNASFPIARPTHFFGKVTIKKNPESLVKKQVL